MSRQSQMAREIQEIPAAVERLLSEGAPAIAHAAEALQRADPDFLVTVARGSSDHVATFLKYASELLLGRPVASVGPSVASLYGAPLKLTGAGVIAISQSGQSPDIVAMANAGRTGGARVLALTNDLASPLAAAADEVINICAGPERSVAATKTFVTSAVAGLLLLAGWSGDGELRKAIHALPEQLSRAAEITWPEVCAAIGDRTNLFTLGRGPSWAMSNEAALKFKETCQLHAESYSSAEVMHGPVSIVETGFPVLALAAGDAAEDALVEVADNLSAKGGAVFATSAKVQNATPLDHIRTDHPLTDPIALIVSFYAMIDRIAAHRRINPDAPRHLSKVTETI